MQALLKRLLKGEVTFPKDPVAVIISEDGEIAVLDAAEAQALLGGSPLVGTSKQIVNQNLASRCYFREV